MAATPAPLMTPSVLIQALPPRPSAHPPLPYPTWLQRSSSFSIHSRRMRSLRSSGAWELGCTCAKRRSMGTYVRVTSGLRRGYARVMARVVRPAAGLASHSALPCITHNSTGPPPDPPCPPSRSSGSGSGRGCLLLLEGEGALPSHPGCSPLTSTGPPAAAPTAAAAADEAASCCWKAEGAAAAAVAAEKEPVDLIPAGCGQRVGCERGLS